MHPIRAFSAFFKTLFGSDSTKETKEPASLPPPKNTKDLSHLRLLNLLQEEARLIDFFKEDLSGFSDEQIGAVVRKLHASCQKRLEEVVTIRPIFSEEEGSQVTIPQGYCSEEVKIIGNASGKAPFSGVLRHKGWKAHKESLPKTLGKQENPVLQAAEVEVQ